MNKQFTKTFGIILIVSGLILLIINHSIGYNNIYAWITVIGSLITIGFGFYWLSYKHKKPNDKKSMECFS